jgi:hypothetical protein
MWYPELHQLGTPQGDFLDTSLQQLVGVLTATSWSNFVGCLDHLTIASIDALKLLDKCECIAERKLEEVYRYMTEVLMHRLLCKGYVGRWTCETEVGGVNGQPMVVGLTRLLKALGIEGRNVRC